MSHHHKKRFGQNFLVNNLIIDKILQVLSIQNHDTWIEIGPGLGALTQPLLQQVSKLIAIEIDRTLIAKLMQLPLAAEKLSIFNTDALTVNYQQWHTNIRLVGNLPYNIATTLLFHLLQFVDTIQDMHFMLQKEVADRLAAQPGCKSYGRLSIIMQYHCQIIPLFDVPPDAFEPQPKVMSTVIRLIPHQLSPYAPVKLTALSTIVTKAFAMRRKTLANNLHTIINNAALLSLQIDPKRRPETLSIDEYIRLANYLEENTDVYQS